MDTLENRIQALENDQETILEALATLFVTKGNWDPPDATIPRIKREIETIQLRRKSQFPS